MPAKPPSIEQLVGDLQWTITSPSLIDSPAVVENGDSIDACKTDAVSDELQQFFANRSTRRVGHYFESLVHFWLKEIRRFEIVAHRQQIRKDGRTIGELDFVFRDNSGALHHWEVAVKFYLHLAADNPTGSHWIGPNPEDYFEKKMERLFEHQMQVSGQAYHDIVTCRAFVKGRIFYHPDNDAVTALPNRLSPLHSRGTWIRATELDWLARDRHPYKILHKPHWLGPDQIDATQTMSGHQMIAKLTKHFSSNRRPFMLSKLDAQHEQPCEIDRIIVVSDHWPQVPKTNLT